MRSGLINDVQFPDEQLNRFVRNVKDAVGTLSGDDDVFASPTVTVATSMTLKPGTAIAVFTGPPGQTIKLPLANSTPKVGSLIAILNASPTSVAVVATQSNTLNGLATSITLPARTAVFVASDGNTAWTYQPGAGRLLRAPQVLTAGTTITHPAGTKTIVVEVVGGGGGGGGAVNSAAAQITLGAGGGSGAYAEKAFAASSLTSTYAIGAAGTAGANTGAAAGNGGATTFTHGGVTVTAPGGNGAPANTGASMAGVSAATTALSGPGTGAAVATNGDLNEGGTDGGWGVRFSGTTGQSGGGAGIYGGGGPGRSTQGNGNAATGPGAGGGGGLSTNAGGAVAGGAGGMGLIVVREYS